jgi:hypothetical protein
VGTGVSLGKQPTLRKEEASGSKVESNLERFPYFISGLTLQTLASQDGGSPRGS